MTRRTVTLMQELPLFLRGCSVEELYQLARALRHDLARRGLLSTMEADALMDTLLGEARTAHRAIFSGDCRMSAADALAHGVAHLGPPNYGAQATEKF